MTNIILLSFHKKNNLKWMNKKTWAQMQMLSCEFEQCLHLSIQHIQTLCGNSFQMLEIYSNPTLGMSCCQSNARGKRVTQLSQVSKCSMMCPQSCPKTGIYGCSVRHTHTQTKNLYITRIGITHLPRMKEIILPSQFCWCWLIEVVAGPSKLQKKK